MIREAIRNIVDREASPQNVREWDERCEYPARLYKVLAEQGYLAMPFREEWGGSGAGPEEMIIVAEELGKRGMDIAAGFGISVFLGLTIQNAWIRRAEKVLSP